MSDQIYNITLLQGNQKTTYDLDSTVVIGSDDDADISIIRAGLSRKHGRFALQNGVLTYTQLTKSGHTKIGQQKCQAKRMYILEEGDSISLGELKGTIGKGQKQQNAVSFQLDITDSALSLEEPEENDDPHKKEILDEDPDGQTLIGIEIFRPNQNNDATKTETVAAPPADIPSAQQAPAQTIKEQADAKKIKKKTKKKVAGKKNKKTKKKNLNVLSPKAKPPKPPGKSKKKLTRAYGSVAGTVPRLVGNIYNFIIFTVVYYYFSFFENILSQDFIKGMYQTLGLNLKALEFLPLDLAKVLLNEQAMHLILCFALWNLATTAFFSVTLGHWAIGLSGISGFVNSRVLGVLRELLSFVTTPLLIFDLPLLVRRKSLKELITRAHVTVHNSKLTIILSVVILPLAIVAMANYNLMTKQEIREHLLGNKVIQTKSMTLKREAQEKSFTQGPQYFASESFGLAVKNYFSHKYKILTKSVTKKGQNPFTYYFYKEDGYQTLPFQYKQILLTSELTPYLKKDPLLPFFHPDLYAKNGRTTELLDAAIPYIYQLLALSTNNLPHYLMKSGFYLAPHFDMREIIYRNIGSHDFSEYKLLKYQGRRYISFKNNRDNKKYFLFVNDLGVGAFLMDNDNPLANILITKILARSKPLAKSHKNYQTTPEQILYNISAKRPLQDHEGELMAKYYTTLAQQAFEHNDDVYTKVILDIFKANEKSLLRAEKATDNQNIAELRLVLNRVQKALYKREAEFFELNQ